MRYATFILALLILAACGTEPVSTPAVTDEALPSVEASTPEPIAIAPSETTAEPTTEFSEAPVETLMPLLTVTPIPLVCGEPTGNPPPAITWKSENDLNFGGESLLPQISEYLRVMGSTEGLEATIEASTQQIQISSEVRVADLTGDGVEEALVVITSWPGTFDELLNVFACADGAFTLLDTTLNSFWGGSTTVEMIEDFNGNQVADILLRRNTISGMKEAQSLGIYEWDGAALAERLSLFSGYGHYGEITLDYRDGDPSIDELLIGFRYSYQQENSAAVNEMTFWRATEMVYRWNGSEYALVCEYFTDTPGMFPWLMIFHNAETRGSCGFHDEAAVYYNQLFDLPGESPEQEYLRAFAGYRLMQIALREADPITAEEILEHLDEAYVPGDQGYAYVAMAKALLSGYSRSGSLERACQAAGQAFKAARGVTDPGLSTEERGPFENFYWTSGGYIFGAEPDNVFEVPDDIDSMVSTPICLQ